MLCFSKNMDIYGNCASVKAALVSFLLVYCSVSFRHIFTHLSKNRAKLVHFGKNILLFLGRRHFPLNREMIRRFLFFTIPVSLRLCHKDRRNRRILCPPNIVQGNYIHMKDKHLSLSIPHPFVSFWHIIMPSYTPGGFRRLRKFFTLCLFITLFGGAAAAKDVLAVLPFTGSERGETSPQKIHHCFGGRG
jgi:hypothetical protein